MDEKYLKKYLKYKQKYDKLKKSMAGGVEEVSIDKILDENKTYVTLSSKTTKKFEDGKYPATYGELTREGMKEFIEGLHINTKGKKLIDLGSGLGKIPLYAVADHHFSFAKGVELADERYNKAVEMVSKLPKQIKDKIEYENGNLLEADIKDYDIIFISNLCFSEDLNRKIVDKLKEAKTGTIIASSKQLFDSSLKLIKTIKVKMSWCTNSSLYIHKKV